MFENGLRPASIYTFKHVFNAFCVLGTVLGARAASQDGRASVGVSEGPSSGRSQQLRIIITSKNKEHPSISHYICYSKPSRFV